MLTESSVGALRYLIAPLWCNAMIGYGASHSAENLGLLGFALINTRDITQDWECTSIWPVQAKYVEFVLKSEY
jgi:predicted AlkP superfamily phosphohydrolase/phosphomutase